MSKIAVCYLAGKFRGPTLSDIDRHSQVAGMFRAPLAVAGVFPLCVHLNEGTALHDLNQDNNGQWWVDATLEVLRRCDVLVLVPGWYDSEGTHGEVKEAIRLGIPIFEATWCADVMPDEMPRPAPVTQWYGAQPSNKTVTLADWLQERKESDQTQQ